jgi:hypothetical protein
MRGHARIGGVLSIVCGGFGILTGILVGVFMTLFGALLSRETGFEGMPVEMGIMMAVVYGLMGLFYVLIGVLGIVGGVYTLKNKYWGLALAGAIAGTITLYAAGIIALIFIVMGRDEFQSRSAQVISPESTQTPSV